MGDWIINEGIRWLLLVAWFAANLVTWLVVYFKYANDAEFHYILYLMGPGLAVARASAACINLNSMMILFPVCRNLISFFRGSCETNRCYRRSLRRQLDKNITFHKLLAYSIAFYMTLHIVSHCFNFQNLYDAAQATSTDDPLASKLSNLPRSGDDSWVNPINTAFSKAPYGLGVVEELLVTTAGWSGIILTMAYVLMFSSATEFIRRSYFETFWITHHLFILYFAMLLTHGSQGIVRHQVNMADHNPVYCSEQLDEWGTDPCPLPLFAAGEPSSWKWCVFPLVIYFLERCIRFYRTGHTVIITKVVTHPSNVVELQMKREGFHMESGQYVFLLCPKVSRLEWHPFTLTSAPEEDHFSVHIRKVGDWTEALAEAVGANQDEVQSVAKLPRISVDGPFGTASIDIFDYEVGVCIAAGIGVTPFASILKSIWYKIQNNDEVLKLKKVYFFWICPDTDAFEWLNDMLSDIENHLMEIGRPGFLEYHIYLSRGWSLSQAKQIYLQEDTEIDAITGLRQKTNYGRPKWDSHFKQIAQDNRGEQIGVFFCGPKVLSKVLHKCCNNYTVSETGGTKFHYNKENF